MLEALPFKLFLSLLLGAAIGLERQSSHQESPRGLNVGVRTFALTSLLGSLAGIFYIKDFPAVFTMIAAVFSVLLVSYYILGARSSTDYGLTTEFSFVYTFIVGVIIATEIIALPIVLATTVIVILLLAFKGKTKKLAEEVSRGEIESFISYAIIALVILPFLPNIGYRLVDLPFLVSLFEGYDLNLGEYSAIELINPRRLWFIVVLVTGIDVLGYVLSKFVGAKHGLTFASFIGGFISSTSITQSLAQKSRKVAAINYLVGAALLANLASFFQVFLLVGPLNARWLASLFPVLLAIIISAAVLSLILLRRSRHVAATEESIHGENKKIFSLIPAIKFALFLLFVKIVTNVALVAFGESGFLISSVLASFVGLDAILVNLATMAGSVVSFEFAILAFILVNATNLLSKTMYSFLQGSRKFALRFLFAAILIVLSSFASFLLFS